MKKRQFTKLALLGLATGALMATQATVSAEGETMQYLAHSCSRNGCSAAKGQTADNYQSSSNGMTNLPKPNDQYNYQNNPQSQPNQGSGSCQHMNQPQNGNMAPSQSSMQYQPQHSCARAQQGPQDQMGWENQTQHSCARTQQGQTSWNPQSNGR